MPVLTPKKAKKTSKQVLLRLVKTRDERFCKAILDHIEDAALGKMIEEGMKGPRVSEEEVLDILKGRSKRRIKEVDDPEMLEALKATKGAKRVSREAVFRALRGQA